MTLDIVYRGLSLDVQCAADHGILRYGQTAAKRAVAADGEVLQHVQHLERGVGDDLQECHGIVIGIVAPPFRVALADLLVGGQRTIVYILLPFAQLIGTVVASGRRDDTTQEDIVIVLAANLFALGLALGGFGHAVQVDAFRREHQNGRGSDSRTTRNGYIDVLPSPRIEVHRCGDDRPATVVVAGIVAQSVNVAYIAHDDCTAGGTALYIVLLAHRVQRDADGVGRYPVVRCKSLCHFFVNLQLQR